MDTIDPIVVAAPLAWDEPPPQASRRWLAFVIAGMLAAAALIAAFTVDIPYYALAPGTARQVNDLVAVPKEQAHPARGRFLMVTVSLRAAKPVDIAESWFDHDTKIVGEEEIVGKTPPKDVHQENLQLMDESKRTAIVVALRRLGYTVSAKGQGALIIEVIREKGYPAEGHLSEGDVITGVDGQPVRLVDEAVKLLQQHKPGDTVRLQVTDAKGASRIEQLTMARGEQGNAILGVQLQTHKLDYDFPFAVDIESGDIGGPSAGLAFTLGVLDELTPGELTGGRKVAVTGTINEDGTVGDVGGVSQKTAAVIRTGAKYFLVPPGEYEDARKRAGKRLEVIKVATLEDAIAALARLGGDVNALGAKPAGSPG